MFDPKNHILGQVDELHKASGNLLYMHRGSFTKTGECKIRCSSA